MQSNNEEKKEGGQPRLERLRHIEREMQQSFTEQRLFEQDAGDEKLTYEEKPGKKYMCTFPYPYMNGYLHIGKYLTRSLSEAS